MSAPPTFGEDDPAVLTVYFLGLGMWTAAAGNDFISSTWKSVRATRRKGKVHVVLVSVPMIYICVYMYFQHKRKDYKEMGAALLALLFALLHLARTFTGLWQLHMFKQWTISAIKSMESLGYETRVPEWSHVDAGESDSDNNDEDDDVDDIDDDDDDNDDNTSESNLSEGSDGERGSHGNRGGNARNYIMAFRAFLKRAFLIIFPEEQDRVKKLADNILVNETLIDNRLSDVHTVCKLCLFSRKEKRNMKKNAKSAFIYRWWLCFRYGFANALRGIPILLSLTFLKSPRLPNPDSAPRLVPENPESIWLKWATALASQTGWEVEEFPDTNPDQFPDMDHEMHDLPFAEQILLSAALHTQRYGGTTSNANTGLNNAGCAQDVITSEFLGFQEWRNYPELCRGRFSKQEFLKHACKTGNGLPYKARHSKAVKETQGGRLYGYSNFESELVRAREALPPEIEIRVKNFNVEQLEWFTIFVSIENWAPRRPSQESVENLENNAGTSTDHSLSTSNPETSQSWNGCQDAVDERKIPLQNLKTQLGVEKLSVLTLEHSKLPLLRHAIGANLWDNRHVLETSCHIDNCISLFVGCKRSEVLREYPKIEREWIAAQSFDPISSSAGGDGILAKIVQESMLLERDVHGRLPPHEHVYLYAQTQFLGCSMEMLRSSLAKWAEKNDGGDDGSWKPPLFPMDARQDAVMSFTASADFMSCLQSLRSFPDMSKMFVKMRMLWELQNHFHTHLPQEGVAPMRGEAMALCILSFPWLAAEAVRLERRRECVVDVMPGKQEVFQIDDYEYVIRALPCPQGLILCVSFETREDKSQVEISVRICEMEAEGETHFDWEMWRNAFYGLLEGRRLFTQQNVLQFSFIPPAYRITSGIHKIGGSKNAVIPQNNSGADIAVWKGWFPHYPKICMFELATKEFIVQPGPDEYSSFAYPISDGVTHENSVSHRTWVPVEYSQARPVWFRNACLVADDVLHANFGFSGQLDAQSAFERAEILLAENSGADDGLALQLIQVSAVRGRDLAALEKGIDILLRNGEIEGAFKLLEEFYTFGNHGKQETLNNSGNLSSFFRSEIYVNKVILLFMKILKPEKPSTHGLDFSRYELGIAVESYQFFLLLCLIHGGKGAETIELFSESLNESEFCNSAASFVFLLEKGINGVQRDIPRAIELYEKGVERDSWNEMYNLGVLLSNGDEDVEQDFPRAIELFNRLSDFYHNSNAMIKLADLLVRGGEGFPINLPRVVHLYSRAMDEDADRSVEAMEKLACAFRIYGDVIQGDIERAVLQYSRAVEEGGTASAMEVVANILQTMDGEVPGDQEQAVALY